MARKIATTVKQKEAINRLQAAGFNPLVTAREVVRGWQPAMDRKFAVIVLDQLEGDKEFAIDDHGDIHARNVEGFWRAITPETFECPGFTQFGMLRDGRFRYSVAN